MDLRHISYLISTSPTGPSGHFNCPLTQGPIELVHTPAVSVSKEVALSTPHYLFRKLPGLFGYSKIARLQAGGRGEALGIRPHPAGCEGRANSTDAVPQFLRFLRLRGSPPLPPAPPKSDPKSDQKSNQKKTQIFDPKWSPKGTLKIPKISPNLQNGTLEQLWRAPLAAFISERVSKSFPRTSRTSKTMVLL